MGLQCPCTFSNNASGLSDDEFVQCMAFWEGRMVEVAFWGDQGLTKDGVWLNISTGQPILSMTHNFSAASKESLHLGIMALAVYGKLSALVYAASPYCHAHDLNYDQCQQYAGGSDAFSHILDVLERKMTSLEVWNKQYPGYGGYLPWFTVDSDGLVQPLLPFWKNLVPALDNGEMIWGLVALSQALQETASSPSSFQHRLLQLKSRVDSYLSLLASTAINVFYNASSGNFRAVSSLKDPFSPPVASNFGPGDANGGGSLDDPYEGEMFVVFAWLYSNWTGLPHDAKQRIWTNKRRMLQNVPYTFDSSTVCSVQRGFWFSSHEQWKYLFMPYTDSATNGRVFYNGELARLHHSHVHNIAGLYASVTNVTSDPITLPPNYVSACGIAQLAFMHIADNRLITPYGSAPSLIVNRTGGLIWWSNMVRATGMHGPLGSTESAYVPAEQSKKKSDNDATLCPLVTWDSKATSLLAAMGGVSHLTRSYMQSSSAYKEFVSVIESEWKRVFPDPLCKAQWYEPSASLPPRSSIEFCAT